MFDLGWPEMLVIAIVLIVVVGPKDLPRMLRSFGRTTAKMRTMAGEFRKQFDEALKEAELDDVKSTIDSARKLNPAGEIKKALNPMEKAASDLRSGLDDMMKSTASKGASSTGKIEEPASPAAASGAADGDKSSADGSVASTTAKSPVAKPAAKAATAKPKKSSASAKKAGAGKKTSGAPT